MAQNLRAWAGHLERGAESFFWRTRGGSEVDCVVCGEAGIWALEVKNSRTVHRGDPRGSEPSARTSREPDER